MRYIIELEFDHAVHFGSSVAGFGVEEVDRTCHSDTLFSGIINQLAAIEHLIPNFNLNGFIEEFNSSKPPFFLSSFGVIKDEYNSTEYFIPKPLIEPHIFFKDPSSKEYQKDFKKIEWISLSDFHKWQKNAVDVETIKKIIKGLSVNYLHVLTKAQHAQDRETDNSQLYHSGQLFYGKDIYPFFLVEFNSETLSWDWFVKALRLLGMVGLGGRRSSGYGKFLIRKYSPILIGGDESTWPSKTNHKNAIKLWEKVLSHKAKTQYLFSLLKPKQDDSSDYVAYSLLPRKGWFYSSSSYYQMKRKTIYMFSEGSILNKPIEGELVNLSPDGLPENHHKIYRNGLPFTIPFND